MACYCHDSGSNRRCWSQPDDCEVDARCCDVSRDGSACSAQGTDRCSVATHNERVKRDKAKP